MASSTLVASPAEILRQLLIDLSIGSDPTPWATGTGTTWPAFASNEPSSPDDCLTTYDTLGQDDGQSMIDGELWAHLGLQLRIRSTDHPTGWQKANAARVALSQSVHLRAVTISPNSYLVWAVTKIGQILAIGKQSPASKRSLFTLNMQMAVRQL